MNQIPLAILGVGNQEMILIFLLLLLLFGAKKLPEFARGLGKSLGEFRKAKDEFEQEITRAQDEPAPSPSPSRDTRHREGSEIAASGESKEKLSG